MDNRPHQPYYNEQQLPNFGPPGNYGGPWDDQPGNSQEWYTGITPDASPQSIRNNAADEKKEVAAILEFLHSADDRHTDKLIIEALRARCGQLEKENEEARGKYDEINKQWELQVEKCARQEARIKELEEENKENTLTNLISAIDNEIEIIQDHKCIKREAMSPQSDQHVTIERGASVVIHFGGETLTIRNNGKLEYLNEENCWVDVNTVQTGKLELPRVPIKMEANEYIRMTSDTKMWINLPAVRRAASQAATRVKVKREPKEVVVVKTPLNDDMDWCTAARLERGLRPRPRISYVGLEAGRETKKSRRAKK